MDIEVQCKAEAQLKDVLETTLQKPVVNLTMLNPSTYTMGDDQRCFVKLFSSISREQLQSFFASHPLNETLLEPSLNQCHVILINDDKLSSPTEAARLLAHWRVATRRSIASSSEKPFDEAWWQQQFASIVNKKKTNYPFFLSNLFTCQEHIASLNENQLETGLLWTSNEHSYYLVDLASVLLTNVDSFLSTAKEIIQAYEEILPLTNDEINSLDTFVRLQLILNDVDDEKHFDLLEHLSSHVNFLRRLVR